jgi:hypothetical protein
MDIIGFGGGSSAPSTGGSAMPPVKMGDKGDFAVRAISCDYAAAAAAAAADDVDNIDGCRLLQLSTLPSGCGGRQLDDHACGLSLCHTRLCTCSTAEP